MGLANAVNLPAKSVKWVQEQAMVGKALPLPPLLLLLTPLLLLLLVGVAVEAVHPEVDQAPPPPLSAPLAFHQAHTGMMEMEGHV